jgi:hypothetical protein
MQYFVLDKKNPPKSFSFKIGEYVELKFREKEFFKAKYPKKLSDVVVGSTMPVAVLFLHEPAESDYVLGLTIKNNSFDIGLFKNLKGKGFTFHGEIIEAYTTDVDATFCEKFRQFILDYLLEVPSRLPFK